MTKPKFQIYISGYVTDTKEEAINKTPIFKAQIRDKTIKHHNMTLDQINNAILGGKTVNFGAVNIKSLLAVDIDNKGSNKTTLEGLTDILKKIDCQPALVYESLGSTLDNPRYRVILRLDGTITSNDAYSVISKGLTRYINLYYPDSADIVASSANTIFYPCRQCLLKDSDSLSSLESLKKVSCLTYPDKVINIDLSGIIIKALVKSGVSETLLLNNLKLKESLFWINYKAGYICHTIGKLYNKKDIRSERFNLDYRHFSNCLLKDMESLESITVPMFKAIIRAKLKMLSKIEIGVFPASDYFDTKKLFSDIFSDDKNLYAKIMTMDDGNQNYSTFIIQDQKLIHQKTYNVIDLLLFLFNSSNLKELEEKLYKFCNVRMYTGTIDSLKANVSAYEYGIYDYLDRYKNLSNLLISMDNSCGKYVLLAMLQIAQNNYELIRPVVKDPKNVLDMQLIAPRTMIAAHIHKEFKKDFPENLIRRHINLLMKLELISYVQPKDYCSYMKKIIVASPNRRRNAYMVPYYNLELLKAAEKNAKNFIKSGASLGSLTANHTDRLMNGPLYAAADKYIKKMLIFNNYVIQQDITHYLVKAFPETKKEYISSKLAKYKDHLAQDNNLTAYKLTKKIIKKYNLPLLDIVKRKIQIDRTNVLIKEQ